MASPLSEEDTNYLRMVYLLTSISPEAVRVYFDRLFPPVDLLVELHYHKTTLQNLKRLKILNASQWSALFPSGSTTARSTSGWSTAVSSTNFDLTLMICLLRNISGIAAPVRGFDEVPLPAETSEGSDLARIKYYRNIIAHSEESKLSNQNLNDAWKDVSEASIRLRRIVIKQKCVNLKICSLDSSLCKQLLLDLKFQEESTKELTDNMEKLMLKVESFEHAYKFLLIDPVPHNIRDRITKVISDWKSSDEMFVETNSSKQLLQELKNNQIVVVTGNTGIGKSFTSRHIALHMTSEGYDILTVKSPKDVISYSMKKENCYSYLMRYVDDTMLFSLKLKNGIDIL